MSHISYIQYKTIKEMEDYKQTLYNDELLNILRRTCKNLCLAKYL